MDQVTLSKEEYDQLKSIQFEYNIIKNTPDKFIKIQLPIYAYRNDKVSYEELRVLSGEGAIEAIKRNCEESIRNLKDVYEEKIERANAIEEKYTPIIELIKSKY